MLGSRLPARTLPARTTTAAAGTAGAVETALDALEAQVESRAPPEELAPQLAALLARISAEDPTRPRVLRLIGVTKNRLGLPQDAIANLVEARSLALGHQDFSELAAISYALSTIYAWRGDGRAGALELLNAMVLGELMGKYDLIALSLAEAGRLALELGRSQVAVNLFRVLTEDRIERLPAREALRARIGLAQALNRTGCHAEAVEAVERLKPDTASGHHRLRLLTFLEEARALLGLGRIENAEAALARAQEMLPPEEHAFERIEYLEAEAELQLAQEDPAAAGSFQQVIARCDEDSLVARAAGARLRLAEALVLDGRPKEAQSVRATALSSTIEHSYLDLADRIRSALICDCDSDELLQLTASDARASGSAIGRRYVLLGRIGAGAFSTVHRALDLEDGGEVALKKIDLSKVYEVQRREQLIGSVENEYRAAVKVSHPGLARVRDVVVERDGTMFVIQDFIDGPTLRGALASGLRPSRLLQALADVADALSALHCGGIVHRDVKPENIILRSNSTPVVVDLGIAQFSGMADRLAGFGTAGYAAPEQTQGGEVDHRADIYSLGAIVAEVCGGRPSWTARLIALVRGEASGGTAHRRLQRLARQMVDADRERRSADLSVVAATLRACAAHLELAAADSGRHQR